MRWSIWPFALVFLFQAYPVASLPSFLPDNFVHWFWQGSVVVGNWLYIDGGEIWAKWNTSANASVVWNMQTIAIDLTQDWMTTTVSAVKVSNRTTAMSPMRRPDMYYDPTTSRVYSLGGDPYQVNGASYNVSQPTQLWSFEPKSDGSVTWALEQGGTTQGFPLTSNIAGGLTATSSTGHYNLGGWIDFVDNQNYIDSKALPGMVDFSFANQSWTNQSFNQHYILGEAQYVPSFGKNGVVLFIGGQWPADASVGNSGAIAGLDKILVYDVDSNSFYQQSATNAPIGRYAFCSAGAGTNSTRNSTYEIFIFGGTRGTDPDTATANALATVYILTLPAFRWIEAPDVAPYWRAVHTCEVIGNRQMISIGGVQDPGNWAVSNDTAWNGLRIFDMTNLSWGQAYDSNAAAYQPSQPIIDFYANNNRYPVWDETALKSIFEVNSSSNTTTPGHSKSKKSSHTGAIVGGVVGGVAALVIIAGIAYWFIRRKRGYGQAPSASPVEMNDNYYNQRKELPGTDDAQVHEIPGQVHQPYQDHQVHEMPGVGPETHELAADAR